MNTIATPSFHQVGDSVILDFQHCGLVENCQVIGVHFYEGSVRYDVCVFLDKDDKNSSTVLEQISSAFVRTAQ